MYRFNIKFGLQKTQCRHFDHLGKKKYSHETSKIKHQKLIITEIYVQNISEILHILRHFNLLNQCIYDL